MLTVVNRAQMQAMDRHAIETVGIPQLVLMESAGRAVAGGAEELLESYEVDPSAVLCLAGTGNNGGDAVVAGRHLSERGYDVTLVVLGSPQSLSEGCAAQVRLAHGVGLEVLFYEGEEAAERVADLLEAHTLLVDGVFGTGLSRPVEGWRRAVLETVEASPLPVVAVDIPSGVDADTGQILGEALTAELTVSFQVPKLGCLLTPGRARCGALRVVDIGIPRISRASVGPTAELISEETVQAALPPRPVDGHKGTFGHLLVVAGAPDRPGSALLCARSAARSGAGLVTLGSDAVTIGRLAPALLELMGTSLGEAEIEPEALSAALERKTALALGPSLEPGERLTKLLKAVLNDCSMPVVLDAGALSTLGEDLEWLRDRPGPTVLTPHPGEAGRMLGLDTYTVQADRVRAVTTLAERSGATVVLKGATTLVAEPSGQLALCIAGGPGLATGGTGDVLTGVIGALLAQGIEPGLAARAGVELHGRAGDRATRALGERAVLASDVVMHLAHPEEATDPGWPE